MVCLWTLLTDGCTHLTNHLLCGLTVRHIQFSTRTIFCYGTSMVSEPFLVSSLSCRAPLGIYSNHRKDKNIAISLTKRKDTFTGDVALKTTGDVSVPRFLCVMTCSVPRGRLKVLSALWCSPPCSMLIANALYNSLLLSFQRRPKYNILVSSQTLGRNSGIFSTDKNVFFHHRSLDSVVRARRFLLTKSGHCNQAEQISSYGIKTLT